MRNFPVKSYQGFILVYSVDNVESFEEIEDFRNLLLKQFDNKNFLSILVG